MQERKVSVQTSLQAIAKKASEQPGYRFRNLFGMLDEDMLKDSWHFIRKQAASGVDRGSAQEYEQNLEENIHQLVDGLKRKRYRAKNVLRRYIPKGNGKFRPLGIPMWRSHCTSYSRVGDCGYQVAKGKFLHN